jgi:hypothetical protein
MRLNSQVKVAALYRSGHILSYVGPRLSTMLLMTSVGIAKGRPDWRPGAKHGWETEVGTSLLGLNAQGGTGGAG